MNNYMCNRLRRLQLRNIIIACDKVDGAKLLYPVIKA